MSGSPRRFKACRENRLVVDEFVVYEEGIQTHLRQKYWPIDLFFRIFEPPIRILSLGRINPHFTDFIIVLRKPKKTAESSQPVDESAFTTFASPREYVG